MTKIEGGLNPNDIPTSDEIMRETLFLDAYGIMASKLTADHPVDPDKWINKQGILDHLIDGAAEYGWEYAGSGFFSAVFIKGGLALKFGFKAGDTGSMYAAWCRKNADLPGVPEVYSISKFTGCYVVLTRRYTELRKDWLDPREPNCVRDIAEEFECIKGAVNRGDTLGLGRFDTVKTAHAIRDFFDGVSDFDLHSSNVMLDHGGNLVITDPISHGPCSGDSEGSYYYTSTYA